MLHVFSELDAPFKVNSWVNSKVSRYKARWIQTLRLSLLHFTSLLIYNRKPVDCVDVSVDRCWKIALEHIWSRVAWSGASRMPLVSTRMETICSVERVAAGLRKSRFSIDAPQALVHSKNLGQKYAICNTSRVSNPHTTGYTVWVRSISSNSSF